MKKKSTIFLVASITLVLIGFCGVFAGISGDGIPAWATRAMVVGGITFLLWLVVLTAETVTTMKANQKEQEIKEAREANAERQAVNRQYQELCQKAENLLKTAISCWAALFCRGLQTEFNLCFKAKPY